MCHWCLPTHFHYHRSLWEQTDAVAMGLHHLSANMYIEFFETFPKQVPQTNPDFGYAMSMIHLLWPYGQKWKLSYNTSVNRETPPNSRQSQRKVVNCHFSTSSHNVREQIDDFCLQEKDRRTGTWATTPITIQGWGEGQSSYPKERALCSFAMDSQISTQKENTWNMFSWTTVTQVGK